MSAVLEVREPSARYLEAIQPTLIGQFDRLATTQGGVTRLRELILTLAVQGKLVPQEPTDEPAEVLLQKIHAEKTQLAGAQKAQRQRLAPEVEEEEQPFKLPKRWLWARLPEISFDLGQGVPDEAFTYIDVAAIDNEKAVVTESVQVIQAMDAPSRARKRVTVGTVIYSTVRPYLKNIAVVEKAYTPGAIASTAFAVMHPHSGIEAKYLLYYLRSAVFTEFVASKMAGIAYPAINDANFFNGFIALPPTAEQARIVARVDELMRLCDALEAKGRLEAEQHARLLATLLGMLTDSSTPEELDANWHRVAHHFDLLIDRPEAVDALEQTILQLAVRGLLVPQNPNDEPAAALIQKILAVKEHLVFTGRMKRERALHPNADGAEPFDLRDGWAWARLQDVCDVRDGTHDTPKYHDTGIPLVTSKNLSSGRLDLTDVKLISATDHAAISARSKVDRDDILFAMIGTIGNPVLVDTNVEFSIKNVALFKQYDRSLSDPRYLLLSLTVAAGEMKAKAAGGVQAFVSLGQIRNTIMAIPPLAEQGRIVARVTKLRRLCADLRQRLAASQTTQSHLADVLVEQGAA